MDKVAGRKIGNTEGFDEFAGRLWIYPDNMAIRAYQKKAVEMALINNAMIVLPTGFGKTFIAAVVMYNFFRWYPSGKIIFVAPTRPLVAQQIRECKKICGVPSSVCHELTGQYSAEKRRDFWRTKRIFFATPQTIKNDLENEIVPAKDLKCIVIDEAHRAQGGYAYVDIIRKLHEHNEDGFRVLALSATPGADIQKVQQVMMNLHIGDVMFRTEDSIDLMSYRNQKKSQAWTVELTGKHKLLVDKFVKITGPTFQDLYRAGLTFNANSIDRVAKFTLVKASQGHGPNGQAVSGKSRFLASAAISMVFCFELLTLYGIREFYAHVLNCFEKPRSGVKTVLHGKVEFDEMLKSIREMFGEYLALDPTKVPPLSVDLTRGHPKLVVLKNLLIKHFKEHADKADTRAIVFTKYRESVNDIVQTLKAYEMEGIRVAAFVGQASGEAGKGMTQKEQLRVINDFKNGLYNVIVATCVAEEGLDIGEVDLIICYDTTSSPISSTQRRGRTGRKRSGDVQTLLTKGYEEKKLKSASTSRRNVEEQLYKRENYTSYYKDAPRMIPAHIVPEFQTRTIEAPDYESEPEVAPKRRRKAKRGSGDEEEIGQANGKKKTKKIISDDETSGNGKSPGTRSEKSVENSFRLGDLWDSDASWD